MDDHILQIYLKQYSLFLYMYRGTSQGKPSEDLLGHSKESVASDPGKNDANKSEDVNKSEDAEKSDDAESSDDVDKSDDAENSDDVDESDEVGKVQKEPPKAKVYSSYSSDASSSYSSSLADLDHLGKQNRTFHLNSDSSCLREPRPFCFAAQDDFKPSVLLPCIQMMGGRHVLDIHVVTVSSSFSFFISPRLA